jgi:hypothetical protein
LLSNFKFNLYRYSAASQKSVDKLTEKFVDKFDLEIESGGESVLETGSSATAAGGGGGGDDEFEEEFGYAFEGKKREGKTHQHEFKVGSCTSRNPAETHRLKAPGFNPWSL